MEFEIIKSMDRLVKSIHAADPTEQDVLIKDLYNQSLEIKNKLPHAIREYATEQVKNALRVAADATSYPYRDEYGCMCNVPAIVLGLESELVNNIINEA